MHSSGGDRLWKWPFSHISDLRDLDLDLGSGHTAYLRVLLIDLCLHNKFCWNRKTLWTDGRTLRPALLGRLKMKVYRQSSLVFEARRLPAGIMHDWIADVEGGCKAGQRHGHGRLLWHQPRYGQSFKLSLTWRWADAKHAGRPGPYCW